MSRRQLLGFFGREEDILAATRAVRQAGFVVADVYSPYAVHGLDKAMGHRRTITHLQPTGDREKVPVAPGDREKGARGT